VHKKIAIFCNVYRISFTYIHSIDVLNEILIKQRLEEMVQLQVDSISNNSSVVESYNQGDVNNIDILLRRVLQSDELALERLFNNTYNILCHLANGIVHSRMLAEEVVTDVFAKLWNKRKTLEITGSAKSYLMVAVRNQALDYIRKYKKEKFNTDLDHIAYLPSEHLDPCALTEFEELYEKVQSGISQLPTQCQRIFKMSREEGMKYKEIADELGLSIKTVETQMGRALKSLRSHVYGA